MANWWDNDPEILGDVDDAPAKGNWWDNDQEVLAGIDERGEKARVAFGQDRARARQAPEGQQRWDAIQARKRKEEEESARSWNENRELLRDPSLATFEEQTGIFGLNEGQRRALRNVEDVAEGMLPIVPVVGPIVRAGKGALQTLDVGMSALEQPTSTLMPKARGIAKLAFEPWWEEDGITDWAQRRAAAWATGGEVEKMDTIQEFLDREVLPEHLKTAKGILSTGAKKAQKWLKDTIIDELKATDVRTDQMAQGINWVLDKTPGSGAFRLDMEGEGSGTDVANFLENLDDPTTAENIMNSARQLRVQEAFEEGRHTDAVIESVRQGAEDTFTNLLLIKALTGAFPGGAGGTGGEGGALNYLKSDYFKGTMAQAGKMGLWNYMTTPGDQFERGKAALTTFAYLSTPAVSGPLGALAGWKTGVLPSSSALAKGALTTGTVFADFLLNTGITYGTGQFEEAMERAEQMRKANNDPRYFGYYMAAVAPLIASDLFFSRATRATQMGNSLKAYRASVPATRLAAIENLQKQRVQFDQNTVNKLAQEYATDPPERVFEIVKQQKKDIDDLNRALDKAKPGSQQEYVLRKALANVPNPEDIPATGISLPVDTETDLTSGERNGTVEQERAVVNDEGRPGPADTAQRNYRAMMAGLSEDTAKSFDLTSERDVAALERLDEISGGEFDMRAENWDLIEGYARRRGLDPKDILARGGHEDVPIERLLDQEMQDRQIEAGELPAPQEVERDTEDAEGVRPVLEEQRVEREEEEIGRPVPDEGRGAEEREAGPVLQEERKVVVEEVTPETKRTPIPIGKAPEGEAANEPVVVTANPRGSSILLSFDKSSRVPSAAEIKDKFTEQGIKVEVISQGSFLGEIRDQARFKVDVFTEDGRVAGEDAVRDVYKQVISDKPIFEQTLAEQQIPIEQRFGMARDKVGEALGVKKAAKPTPAKPQKAIKPAPEVKPAEEAKVAPEAAKAPEAKPAPEAKKVAAADKPTEELTLQEWRDNPKLRPDGYIKSEYWGPGMAKGATAKRINTAIDIAYSQYKDSLKKPAPEPKPAPKAKPVKTINTAKELKPGSFKKGEDYEMDGYLDINLKGTDYKVWRDEDGPEGKPVWYIWPASETDNVSFVGILSLNGKMMDDFPNKMDAAKSILEAKPAEPAKKTPIPIEKPKKKAATKEKTPLAKHQEAKRKWKQENNPLWNAVVEETGKTPTQLLKQRGRKLYASMDFLLGLDAIKELIPKGTLRSDEMAEILRALPTPEAAWRATHESRKAERARLDQQAKDDVELQATLPGKDKEPVQTKEMGAGTEFKVDGEKFTVEVDDDGRAFAKDGARFDDLDIDKAGILQVDKGSLNLKKADESFEFGKEAPTTPKAPWEMSREDFEKAIEVKDISEFAETRVEDWGALQGRQQGKRRGGMVKGAMGDATLQGKKAYTNLFKKLPDYEENKVELSALKPDETPRYIGARAAGFDHDTAMLAAYRDVDTHKQVVQNAIAAGKSVPQKIIDSYPDLGKPAEPTKEPWEMSSKEYVGDRTGDARAVRLTAHVQHVKRALKAGAQVPQKVIREYIHNNWAKDALAKLKQTKSRPSPNVARVQPLLDDAMKTWSDVAKAKVTLLENRDQMSEQDKRRMKLAEDVYGPLPNMPAYYVQEDGRIVILANNLTKPQNVRKILFHEGLGHAGWRAEIQRQAPNAKAAEQEINKVLDSIWESQKDTPLMSKVLSIHEYKPDVDRASLKTDTQRAMADEYLARLAEADLKPTTKNKIVNGLLNMLRKVFPEVKWTKSDVVMLLEQSRRYMEGKTVTEVKPTKAEAEKNMMGLSPAKAEEDIRIPTAAEVAAGEPNLPHGKVENDLQKIFKRTASPTTQQLRRATGAPTPRDINRSTFLKDERVRLNEEVQAGNMTKKQADREYRRAIRLMKSLDREVKPTSYDELKEMVKIAQKEGLSQPDWYKKFGDGIREIVGKANMPEASALFGVTSQRSSPEANLFNTFRIMALARQIDPLKDPEGFKKAVKTSKVDGKLISLTGQQIDKILDIYRTGEFKGAIKTTTYAQQILDKSMNLWNPFSVQDVNMARVFGFRRKAVGTDGKLIDGALIPNEAAARYSQYLTTKLANEFGMKPEEAQSMLWGYARNYLSPGGEQSAGTWESSSKYSTPAIKQIQQMIKDGTFSKDQAFDPVFTTGKRPTFTKATKTDKFSNSLFSGFLKEVAREVAPTAVVATPVGSERGFDFPNVKLQWEDVAKLHKNVAAKLIDPETGQLKWLQQLGVPHEVYMSAGTWAGLEPNFQVKLIGGTMDQAKMVAELMGDALYQDASIIERPVYDKGQAFGVRLTKPDGSKFTVDELKAMAKDANPEGDPYGLNFSVGHDRASVKFLDGNFFDAMFNNRDYTDAEYNQFTKTLGDFAKKFKLNAESWTQEGDLYEHKEYGEALGRDWSKEGGAEQSDIQRAANDYLYTPAKEVYEEFRGELAKRADTEPEVKPLVAAKKEETADEDTPQQRIDKLTGVVSGKRAKYIGEAHEKMGAMYSDIVGTLTTMDVDRAFSKFKKYVDAGRIQPKVVQKVLRESFDEFARAVGAFDDPDKAWRQFLKIADITPLRYEKEIAGFKERMAGLRESMNQNLSDVAQKQGDLVKYVKANLPPSIRGKILSRLKKLADAKRVDTRDKYFLEALEYADIVKARDEQSKQKARVRGMMADTWRALRRAKSGKSGVKVPWDAKYSDRIEEYLTGISTMSGRRLEQIERAWEHFQEAKDGEPIPAAIASAVEEVFKPNLNNMSTEELREVEQELSTLKERGKLMTDLKKAQAERELAAKAEIASSEMDATHGRRKLTPKERAREQARRKDKLERWWEGSKEFLAQHARPERVIKSFSDFKKGSMAEKEVWDKAVSAEERELRGMASAKEAFEDIYSDIDVARAMKDSIDYKWTDVDERGTKTDESGKSTINEAMFIYANSKNDGNLAHLLGTGYTVPEIRAITDALPQQYKDAVDAQLKYYDDTQWARMNEVFRREHNVTMPKENNYFPIRKLATLSGKTAVLADMLARARGRAGIEKGSTKGRTGSLAPFKDLDYFKTVIDNMRDTEHYIAYNDAIRDINKFINNEQVRASMEAKSPVLTKMMDNWVKDIAIGRMQQSTHAIDKAADFVRMNGVPAVLGLNLVTVLKQTASLPQGMTRLDNKASVLGAVADWAQGPLAARDFAMEKSTLMKNRRRQFNRDLQEILEKGSTKKMLGKNLSYEKFKEFATHFIGTADVTTTTILWNAKYNEVIKKTGNEQQAIKDADALIRNTQPMGGMTHLPQIYRTKGIAKLYTAFTNQLNQNANMAWELSKTWKGQSVPKNIVDIALMTIIPSAIVYSVSHGLANPLDDPEGWAEATVNNSMGGILGLGQVMKGAMGVAANYSRDKKLLGKWSGDYVDPFSEKATSFMPPLLGQPGLFTGKGALRAASTLTGIPYFAGQKLVSGLQEVADDPGDVNSWRKLFWSDYALRPLGTDKGRKRRKRRTRKRRR